MRTSRDIYQSNYFVADTPEDFVLPIIRIRRWRSMGSIEAGLGAGRDVSDHPPRSLAIRCLSGMGISPSNTCQKPTTAFGPAST